MRFNKLSRILAILLSGDVINTEKKDRIKVDGKDVVIDLKGHTLDRISMFSRWTFPHHSWCHR